MEEVPENRGARMFRYYPTAAWKTSTFECPQCGWSGTSDAMDRGTYNELMNLSCPRCDKMLAIVGYPTSEEVRTAAAAGEAEAIEEVKILDWGERFHERRLRSQLQSPDELPDETGDELQFSLIEQRRDILGAREVCFVIRIEDRVIWFEIAGYESWWRIPEIKQIFRDKYGKRMKSFDVQGYAWTYGDEIGSPSKLERALAEI